MKRVIKSLKKNIIGIVFWIVFLSLFIILSSFLIIRASGYAYNFNTKKLQKTGLIYLKTNPKAVDIYLDGKPRAFQTPKRFSYLLPGNYTIEIKKDGYQTITKNLKVYEGLVTAYSNILLFKNIPKLQTISGSKVSDFIVSAGKTRIFFQNQNGFRLYDIKKEGKAQSINFTNQELSTPADLLDWSYDPLILAKTNSEYIVFDLDNKEIKKPSEAFPNLTKIEIINDNQAIVLSDEKLYRLNLDNLQSDLMAEGVGNFGLDGQGIYYFKKSEDKNSLILITNFGEREIISSNKISPASDILISPDNQIAVYDKNSSKLFYIETDNGKKEPKLLSSAVSNASWSQTREFFNFREKYKLLYSCDNEIWLFQKNAKNLLGEEDERRLITRFDTKVLNLGFFRLSDYFYYQTLDSLYALDEDGMSNKLADIGSSGFNFDQEFKELYFIDNTSGSLVSWSIR